MTDQLQFTGSGERLRLTTTDGPFRFQLAGGGESLRFRLNNNAGTGKGVVVSDTAPVDTSVLWVDTSDDSSQTTNLIVLGNGDPVPPGTAAGTVVFYEAT